MNGRSWLVILALGFAPVLACQLTVPSWWPGAVSSIPTRTGRIASTWHGLPSATQPPPTASPNATRTPSPTYRTPPTRTARPTPTVTLDAPVVVSAELVADTKGWVRTAGMMLWTDDGGSSWRDISPPAPEDAYLWWPRFFDPQHGIGLLVGIPPNSRYVKEIGIRVLRTEDGGRSWEGQHEWSTLEFVHAGYPRFAWALDSDRIWVSVDTTEMANSSQGELFRTLDGGRTWSRSRLPLSASVTFVSSDIGFAVGSPGGAPLQLYRTGDGGNTWLPQSLAPEPDDLGFGHHEYRPPVFISPIEGLAVVALRDPAMQQVGVALYHTRDAGETWKQIVVFEGVSEVVMGDLDDLTPLEVVSPTTWGVVLGNVAAFTHDAGHSWKELPLSPASMVTSHLFFTETGFAWELTPQNVGALLYRSNDWGQHWELVSGPW